MREEMSQRWNAEEILNLVRAFQPACILTAAAELDIFSVLCGRSMTAKSLAGKLNSDIRATTILLDALAALELLVKKGSAYRVPAEVAEILSEAGPRNILPAVRHLGNCLRRWTQLARVTQTGKPADRHPSIRGEAADLAAFIGAMDNFSAPLVCQVLDCLGPLTFRHLLDIGGGPGTWTIAFLCAAAGARATLFDLPEVIPLARQRIADAGLSDRVNLVAGDYNTDDLPASADFAWLSSVAHQNSRQQNRALFAKIYAALQVNGVLVIRDVVMDESRTQPTTGALFAVNMLVGTEAGGTYTFDEFQKDLCNAGFSKIALIHHDGYMHYLMQAVKPRI
jgi:SAM-dependent methyltransferase